MTDTAQPITVFDEMSAGSVKGMQKDTGAKSVDLWMVPYDELKIADGFNVRLHDKDYQSHIDWLTGQMVEHGYKRDKPMTGYVVKEDGKNVVYVTDGHSRHAAVAAARAAGAEIELIPVIVHPPGTSAEDLTVSLVTANSGKPLSPYEVATVCKRLQGYGHDEKAIAKKLGYTVPYVKNLFDLLAAPKAVRDMVTTGKVSATLAVQTMKKHGKEAASVLKAGAVEAESKGKTKVTGKHVKKASPVPAKKAKAATKPAAEPITAEDQIVDLLEGIGASEDHRDVLDFLTGAGLTPATATRVHMAVACGEKKLDLIKRMADYIRTIRVGDDAQDLLDEADLYVPKSADTDDL